MEGSSNRAPARAGSVKANGLAGEPGSVEIKTPPRNRGRNFLRHVIPASAGAPYFLPDFFEDDPFLEEEEDDFFEPELDFDLVAFFIDRFSLT